VQNFGASTVFRALEWLYSLVLMLVIHALSTAKTWMDKREQRQAEHAPEMHIRELHRPSSFSVYQSVRQLRGQRSRRMPSRLVCHMQSSSGRRMTTLSQQESLGSGSLATASLPEDDIGFNKWTDGLDNVLQQAVDTVYENQRYQLLSLGWAPCTSEDCMAWTDKDGNPVTLDVLPCDDPKKHWMLEDGADTDKDGWTYGNTFTCLSTPRDGGRSTRRSTDWVRRRVWRRSARADHANMAYTLNVYKQKRCVEGN
jgi:hypothetical protein